MEAIIKDRTLVSRAMSTVATAAVPATAHAAIGFGGMGSSQSPTSDPPTIAVAKPTMNALRTIHTVQSVRASARRAAAQSGGRVGRGYFSEREPIGLPRAFLASVPTGAPHCFKLARTPVAKASASGGGTLDRRKHLGCPQQRLQRKRKHCSDFDTSGLRAPRNQQCQHRRKRCDRP